MLITGYFFIFSLFLFFTFLYFTTCVTTSTDYRCRLLFHKFTSYTHTHILVPILPIFNNLYYNNKLAFLHDMYDCTHAMSTALPIRKNNEEGNEKKRKKRKKNAIVFISISWKGTYQTHIAERVLGSSVYLCIHCAKSCLV